MRICDSDPFLTNTWIWISQTPCLSAHDTWWLKRHLVGVRKNAGLHMLCWSPAVFWCQLLRLLSLALVTFKLAMWQNNIIKLSFFNMRNQQTIKWTRGEQETVGTQLVLITYSELNIAGTMSGADTFSSKYVAWALLNFYSVLSF